jgi:hypothetical protein
MKKLLFLFAYLLFTGMAQSQFLKISSGSNLTILSGTTFSSDGLMLIPSADFILSNTTLSKSATVIHKPFNNFISRVYQFSSISNPFSGTIKINYADGAELNGIQKSILSLNIFNGTAWIPYVATTRDTINNFVLTTGLNAVTLNEVTLATWGVAVMPITIIGNPVTNGILTIRVNTAADLSIFASDGKLVWLGKVDAGIQNIDVSRLAKGVYFIKVNSSTKKIIIQ